MKILCLGAQRIDGTSKAGNAFDMYQLLVAVPIESGSFGKARVQGAGVKQMDMPLAPESLSLFLSMKYPGVYEVETDSRPQMGKMQATAISISAVVASSVKVA